jgi:adenylate cyclase
MALTRRLAAILAADVAGYSRLMGTDEEGTHERLKSHLAELVHPNIKEHRGRVVKNTGDGLLAEFASVVDAVRCAVETQRGMAERNAAIPVGERIEFRIGINLGDVISEDEDIFGDGVNVAARLEGLAASGGICVSGTVRDHIGDRVPYAFVDMGEQNVKNIAQPVRVYALDRDPTAGFPVSGAPIVARRRRWWQSNTATALAAAAALVLAVIGWRVWPVTMLGPPSWTTEPAIPPLSKPLIASRLSIVVLPFANLSNDPAQQYFADGITEDLTTDLSRIADMLVISRDSAFTYKDKAVNAKQIGRELGVRYVLEGSVQRSGNQVRINAQLIDAETDTHLWAQRFDGDTSDLFALQDEITSRIALALNAELINAEASRPTAHPDALDYIFQGRAIWNKPRSRETVAEAMSRFEHALALDPGSAEARSFLADALVGRVLDFGSSSDDADLKRAGELATKAVVASPRSAEAHFAKGDVWRVQRRCKEAIPEYETALALNRNFVAALASIGRCQIYIGQIEAGMGAEERALRLSPRGGFDASLYYRIGEGHLLLSQIDEAIGWFEKARDANPAFSYIPAYLAAAYAIKGEAERAAAELAEARKLCESCYKSIAHMRARTRYETPDVRARAEATLYAGLRKAGMPEE